MEDYLTSGKPHLLPLGMEGKSFYIKKHNKMHIFNEDTANIAHLNMRIDISFHTRLCYHYILLHD